MKLIFENKKMCGIWALFGVCSNSLSHYEDSFFKLHHRGPDAWRVQHDQEVKDGCLGFVRLSIVDSVYGMQPMTLHEYPELTLICNGELYNCKRLGEEFNFKYETKCDVECIIRLFSAGGIEHCVQNLDGVFAFILVDKKNQRVYVGRDPYGVRPLFRLKTEAGIVGFSSEGKGLMSLENIVPKGNCKVEQYPPGHYSEYKIEPDGKTTLVQEKRYYKIGDKLKMRTYVPASELKPNDIKANIRTLLTAAVRKRLMAERRIGCLLSGGLDSSLIAAILVQEAKAAGIPYKIQSFAIGMGESPDILAARQVAKHIGTEHHEINFTPADIAEVLDNVIYHLETADITTIRASIGMYLIAKYIQQNTDSTVILSGEGADELAQGYIYFRDAPNAAAGDKESHRLLNDIYMYDGLRADRTTSAHSLELRVPFLDLQFSQYYLSLPAELRQPQNGVEKFLLRSAFDKTNLIPDSILWRHKEAFSDGVTSVKKSLFQVIQEFVDAKIPNDAVNTAAKLYPHCTPKTKESVYYRKMFEKFYSGQAEWLVPYFWMPKWTNVSDPSARFIKHYAAKDDGN
ncbi:asparagine synthetase isoform X2 [Lycorma delicatula]|uniref:asparagine synthetase isoform X2 n=1 Tax=Lycorma delicatula TaxID=130591 RepID=UPI003F510DA0